MEVFAIGIRGLAIDLLLPVLDCLVGSGHGLAGGGLDQHCLIALEVSRRYP